MGFYGKEKRCGQKRGKKCRQRHRESCSRRYGGQCGEKGVRRRKPEQGEQSGENTAADAASMKANEHAYEIGELDHYLFGQGNHYEIYKKLGAHK